LQTHRIRITRSGSRTAQRSNRSGKCAFRSRCRMRC
jgi:hypothetical protein